MIEGVEKGSSVTEYKTGVFSKSSGDTKLKFRKTPKGKMKKLNYNPSEVTSMILQAVNSNEAGIALIRAKSKLANLLNCKENGKYNENEVSRAVRHAKKVIYCAKIKKKNLQKEEKAERQISKIREREREKELERLREELAAKKKKNRLYENAEIEEARKSYGRTQDDEKDSVNVSSCGIPVLPESSIPQNAAAASVPAASVEAEAAPVSSVDICL